MHPLAAGAITGSVIKRASQGDCPTEPAHSVETLEETLIEVNRMFQAEQKIRTEMEAALGKAVTRIEMVEAALWYWIDDYVENNDDPTYEDPFWFLKDKPFYPILQERLKVLTQSDAGGGGEHG